MSNSSSVSEELPPFPTPEISSLALSHKPSAKLAYTFYPASQAPPDEHHSNPFATTLVVFLNGLLAPRSTWDPAITQFIEKRIRARLPYPSLLTYDRYGQGQSDRDPSDTEPPPCHGHDCLSAVEDLHQFLKQIWRLHIDVSSPNAQFPAIIFVCNSIGCALARLYAQKYRGTVSGLLFLDSVMANSDFVSFWPDPDEPGFDDNCLPPGVSDNDVRETREKYRALFHPSVANMEGLSRRNLAQLLPSASGPKLEGFGGEAPFLTVVGHDWETFAEQSLNGKLRTPEILTMTYLNPVWRRYNEGLAHITDEDKVVGPIVAVECGHFIQQDGPGFVSDEIVSLLDRVVNRVDQLKECDMNTGDTSRIYLHKNP